LFLSLPSFLFLSSPSAPVPSTSSSPILLSPLSLHDALPISSTPDLGNTRVPILFLLRTCDLSAAYVWYVAFCLLSSQVHSVNDRSEEHTTELQSRFELVGRLWLEKKYRIVT